jgi:hypothetical protein
LTGGAAAVDDDILATNSNTTTMIRNTLSTRFGKTVHLIKNPRALKIQLLLATLIKEWFQKQVEKNPLKVQFKVMDKIFSSQRLGENNNLFLMT